MISYGKQNIDQSDIDAVVDEFTEDLPSTKEKPLPLPSPRPYRRKLNAQSAKGTSVKSVTTKEKSK